MNSFTPPELITAFPEIFLAIMSLMLLMLGVAGKEEKHKTVSNFAALTLLLLAGAVYRFCHGSNLTFNDMFINDTFGAFMKVLVLIGSAVSVYMSTHYLERQRIMRFEYPVLIMFSTLGMMLMISAHDLISLYMGLELQSLPLYVLAAFQRDTVRSTEAGLKYFVLGALSSGMLLYGASLLYGYTGTTEFTHMANVLNGTGAVSLGVIVGMVLLLSGLAFKISAVPFHMWTPDVYEGAPTSVTAFFAIVPKIAALALITRVFMGPFGHIVHEWRQVIVFISVASMVLGAVAAVRQTNIKRLLAYSSIGNMGYALVGLVAASEEGVKAIMIFTAIYMVTSIGAFAVVLMMKQRDRMVENIYDLAGLGQTQPMLALAMTVMMFSMAGIPPLAGFFGKLFVFQAAINAHLYALSIIGVLTSVVAAYYYLRVIKVMYFDAASDDTLDRAEDRRLNGLLAVSALALVLFIIAPGPLLTTAQAAAQSLFAL
ncbi:MAG: NADH-quinone oxidoreductase subunit NuoN [Alphaproteobacteria bacterium]|nr:NADH-quinone oxidoreductase subunit NuoN [Alphaproteobacteria bacterium]